MSPLKLNHLGKTKSVLEESSLATWTSQRRGSLNSAEIVSVSHIATPAEVRGSKIKELGKWDMTWYIVYMNSYRNQFNSGCQNHGEKVEGHSQGCDLQL